MNRRRAATRAAGRGREDFVGSSDSEARRTASRANRFLLPRADTGAARKFFGDAAIADPRYITAAAEPPRAGVLKSLAFAKIPTGDVRRSDDDRDSLAFANDRSSTDDRSRPDTVQKAAAS